MRADRLLSLVLLLQARGGTTARTLATELGVSVRTVYRDLGALGAAGVPVITESGPGGGCRLMDGYRFPLRGLRPEEAEALLILGVPTALRELGLQAALTAAHRQIQVTTGLRAPTLVHLDMPRWFGGQPEEAPCLRELAQALRLGRKLAFRYSSADARNSEPRVVGPLGLVNKAGTWYLVAMPGTREAQEAGDVRVFRAGRIGGAFVLTEPFHRPADFQLAEFWARWSADFEASRPRLQVTIRASPEALEVFHEIFGQAVVPALEAARPPDENGWRVMTLWFEHELAASHRLAGLGGRVQVLSPPSVRDALVATAREILTRYDAAKLIPIGTHAPQLVRQRPVTLPFRPASPGKTMRDIYTYTSPDDPGRQDDGLFGPGSVTWRLTHSRIMWVAAVRALLLQALHPRVIRGTLQNATAVTEPVEAWARLRRTRKFVETCTYGTVAEAERACDEAKEAQRLLFHPPVPEGNRTLNLALPPFNALAFSTLPGWARRMYGRSGGPLTDIAATAGLRAARLALGQQRVFLAAMRAVHRAEWAGEKKPPSSRN